MSDVVLFRHAYYHPPLDEVEGGGESMTDPTGYIPAEKMINDMLMAGQRLQDSRDGYEFLEDEEVPDDYIDPTRSPGFDLADASAIALQTRSRLNDQAKKATEAKAVQPEVKISEESGSSEPEKK